MITLIAAIGKNNELGKNNDLIWHLPNDLKRFKKLTTGHHIVMGRKTFESIGKPLPNRTSVIITRDLNYTAEGCIVVHSLQAAIEACNEDHIFIIGGAQIYEEAIKMVDVLDICMVDACFDADVFFPEIDLNTWKASEKETFTKDNKHQYNYSFTKFVRK